MSISDAVLQSYPRERLQSAYKDFVWRDADHQACWSARDNLSWNLNNALDNKSRDDLIRVLEEIQKWGLVGDLPQSVRDNADDVLRLLREAREDLTHEIMVNLLGFKGAKIATVSKWICLLDQEKYAIYDSRVSVALRNVTLNGQRHFPIVSRAIQGAWPSDSCVLWKMARYFLDYLACMREVGKKVDMLPSRVEMALFMIGDQRCDAPEAWRNNRPQLRRVTRAT